MIKTRHTSGKPVKFGTHINLILRCPTNHLNFDANCDTIATTTTKTRNLNTGRDQKTLIYP